MSHAFVRHTLPLVGLPALLALTPPTLDGQEGYQKPPKEILDVRARYGLHRGYSVAHAGTLKICSFQFDQNARICNSSS